MSDDLVRTVADMQESEELPEGADDLVFDAPWQARAFALVITLYHQGVFEWSEFQRYLIEEVQADDEDGDPPTADGDDDEGTESIYYQQWIAAFERLLADKGLFQSAVIERRTAEFEAGERDASEFVIGEHTHDHSHRESLRGEGRPNDAS
jgi:nitrile hydratase accessory protein